MAALASASGGAAPARVWIDDLGHIHVDHNNQLVPKLIAPTATQQGRVVEVAAGARWSLLRKDDGEVVTLGGERTPEDDAAW